MPGPMPGIAQIGTTEQAVRTGTDGFREDLEPDPRGPWACRSRCSTTCDLLARARLEYLDAIVDYNEAQFQLFVALGQPPADALAHPVPTAGVVPRGEPIPTPANPSPPTRSARGADRPHAVGRSTAPAALRRRR